MFDILWTPIIVFSLWAYIGLNVFRYKYFEYKRRDKSLILFLIFRIIVIAALITYLFLSFNDYVFYCQMKLYFYFISIIGIIGVEMMYSYFLDEYFGEAIPIIISFVFVYIGINAISWTIMFFALREINKQLLDTITVKYEILLDDEKNTKYKNKTDQFFGIEGYRDDGEYYYSFYCLEKDGKLSHESIDETSIKDNIYIIDEDKMPYIEVTLDQYVANKEKLEKTIKEENKSYKLYAPKSAFHGEFNGK